MAIEFDFIGWCNDQTNHHDKVWFAFRAGNSYYCGWGKRGKSLTFKKHVSAYELSKVRRKKDAQYGGEYEPVDAFKLFAIFPDFEEVVEKYLSYAMLANKIK